MTFPSFLSDLSRKGVWALRYPVNPAVIDFYATWCGPCRMVAPLLKSLAKEYKDQIVVYKVDTDKQKELSAAMGIQSLPTIIFIPKTGQPQIIIGAANKTTFRKAIEEVLLKE